MGEIIKIFPWGWIGTLGDNEIEIVSTKRDPPKVRQSVVADRVESNLGSVCFNLRRTADPADERQDEMAYVMGRLTADKQQGALYVALAPSVGQHCREVLYLDPNRAIFRVPVTAPNLGGAAAYPARFASDDGRYVFIVQGDDGGKIVQYDRHGTDDESQWTAVAQFRGVPV